MAVVLCCAIPSIASAASVPFDFRWHVGLADNNYADSIWVAIEDTTLAVGDSLTFLWNPEGSDSGDVPALTRGAVAERILRPNGNRSFGSMWDQRTDGARLTQGAFYRATSRDTKEQRGLGFAFRAPVSAFHMSLGRIECDLDTDGSSERFSVCTSYEDIHLSIWTGAPYQGLERWRVSYYVPYDLEPTCPGIPEDPNELK